MPKTKFQGVIFGLLMSITMAYGMEVYNVALKEGGLSQMTNQMFWGALLEAFLHTVFISSCTVLIMCPTMSAVAAVLFSVILGGGSWTQLPAYWVATVLKNFPMALLWNLFAAGPLTRLLFRRLFARQLAET